MFGGLIAQNFEGALHAGAGRHGGLGATAQVSVIKVGQSVGGRAHLLAGAGLTPGGEGAGRAHALEQLRNGLAVAHHHAVGTAHLAGLRNDVEATGGTHESQGGLGAGAGKLQCGGTARLGQGAVRQECAAHDGLRILQGTVDHGRRQAAHGATAHIQQTGLTGQGLAALIHAHHVAATAAQAATGDAGELGVVTVNLRDDAAHAVGGGLVIYLRFHHDSPRDNVQTAGEAQNR